MIVLNEEYEDHTSFDKHPHKNKELKKILSADEEKTIKRQRK